MYVFQNDESQYSGQILSITDFCHLYFNQNDEVRYVTWGSGLVLSIIAAMCNSVAEDKIYGGAQDGEHVLLMTDAQHLNISHNNGQGAVVLYLW
jgi:S-adenosylmethionine hydrolase